MLHVFVTFNKKLFIFKLFFQAVFHYVALNGLELRVQMKLASNLTEICLLLIPEC